MIDSLHHKSAAEIAALVNSQKITAVAVAQYFVDRATSLNPKLNAFNSITSELALRQAAIVDTRVQNGEQLPLAGVPIAVKDNLCVTGTRTTCSSRILENFVAPFESTVTARLWEAGAVCLGKTNLDEFAMGSSTEHSAFGPSRNPWNTDCVPGGSSGGSAVAVAARLAPLAIGSDTGGSIRQPAALCGIVGMKPTYGLVSRYGLIAFASSLDQIGPFARNVADADLMLSVMAGHDERDSTSLQGQYARQPLSTPPKSKIGLVKDFMSNDSAERSETEQAVLDAVNGFVESQQWELLSDLQMPIAAQYALDCYYIIAPAEASSNLSRYDGVRFGMRDPESKDLRAMFTDTRAAGFGAEVRRRIIIGTYCLSAGYYDAYYKKAQQVRRLITEEYDKIFEQVDFIVTPTSPITAFPFGAKLDDPLAMYLCDIQTIPINLAGLPSVSINCGFDRNNLPIGLQIIAPYNRDRELLQFAAALEGQLLHTRIPDLAK